MYLCMCECVCNCINECVHKCMHECVAVCVHECVDVCMHVCVIYACVHMCGAQRTASVVTPQVPGFLLSGYLTSSGLAKQTKLAF